jgi:beta-lactamase regulating signal transducer with metallopeptidase domain/HEAT repeat protein
MPTAWLSEVVAHTGAWSTLLVLLAKATLILAAAIVVTRAMPRAAAGTRHLVWLVTLATLLLLPALAAWAPLEVQVLPPMATATSRATHAMTPSDAHATPAMSRHEAAPVVQRERPAPVDAPGVAAAAASEQSVQASTNRPAGRWTARVPLRGIALVVAIWGAVALAVVASFAWSAAAVRRIVRHARPLDEPAWRVPLLEIADRMGLADAPRLLVSRGTTMPFACGVLVPTIVLPEGCDGWSLDRRRAVLLHEMAHVRRRDLAGHVLGQLACALYWFHPLVWMAAARLRAESERACDDLALVCGTRAADYAEHLLDIVTAVRRARTPRVALAMARRKEFEGRMLAILDPELPRHAPSRRRAAALVGAVALGAGVVATVAPVRRVAAAAVPAMEHGGTPARGAESAAALGGMAGTARDGAVLEHTGHAADPAPSRVRGTMRSDTSTATMDERRAATPRDTGSDDASMGPTIDRAVSSAVTRTVTDVASRMRDLAVEASIAPALRRALHEDTSAADDRAALLAKVLRTDSSSALRRIAAWGLRDHGGSPTAAPALVEAVQRDRDAEVREMAAWALADYEATDDVTAALGTAVRSDTSERVRATAAWALGALGASGATDALAAALFDRSERVRVRAAWALGHVEPKQAPKALLDMLRDARAENRRLAAWALYRIQDPAALPALQAALRAEQDADLQVDYVRAIAAMGDVSLDAIRGLLESPDARVRAMAVRALAGGRAAGPWPWPWPEPRPNP